MGTVVFLEDHKNSIKYQGFKFLEEKKDQGESWQSIQNLSSKRGFTAIFQYFLLFLIREGP